MLHTRFLKYEMLILFVLFHIIFHVNCPFLKFTSTFVENNTSRVLGIKTEIGEKTEKYVLTKYKNVKRLLSSYLDHEHNLRMVWHYRCPYILFRIPHR